ncbi:MAG: nucleotidyltransferase family protein [Brevundimonas sp.]|uniref:nucleotidyltransferase family protein n=1 Tax=Brevundimonas sp. TaxID=1871086 RepID=UPI00262E1BCF|nr:nucleotidyltransferase family protein [Brevundimonas sp.]MDI6624992.1 nucleotidyltransferase family protein [Brevundimonas sp.]MDQ7812389.1 nucleotidyltransferase family protein [Brevundimonas sp.]
MRNWQRALIGPEATFRDALVSIDSTGAGMALVVDADNRLLGVLSDGDLRRALIRGAGLEDAALTGANREPFCIDQHQDRAATLTMLRAHGLRQLPVLDADRRVVGLTTVSDFLNIPIRSNPVVIMAGGKGERLAELTRDTPKPMLKVGPRPILDTIVGNLAGQGFRNFWLAVNYKAEQIERHFGDGSALGLDIRYLRETRPLGTCGALALLPTQEQPLIVTNGDVLAKVDYGHVLESHLEAGADATVVVRDYEMQVPFGVVNAEAGRILRIDEKPTQSYTISAGAYVLSPSALRKVPADAYYDMPSLIADLIGAGMSVRQQRAEGYWMDIGRPPDYAQANADFGTVFEV